MALTEITKVTGPGIHTLSNIVSHNINSSGIITATEFDGKFSGTIVGTAATFSGNVTIGGTLTYEDVTNIDSVGIVTARQGIFIDDSITHIGDTNTKIRFPAVDTFTVETSGTERLRIKSGGDISVTGDKAIYFGANEDLMVGHDGSSTRIEDSYGFLAIKSNAIEIRSYTDSELYAKFTRNGAAELYYDNVKSFETTPLGIKVPDSKRLSAGNDEDLKIYHNGSTNSFIAVTGGQVLTTNSDSLVFKNAANNQTYATFTQNGAAELYFNGSKKFETTHMGGVLAGILTATTFSGSGASLTNLNGSNIASGTVSVARIGTGTKNTSTFYRGDGTFATVTSTTINSNADNRIITGSGTANTLNAEPNFTWNTQILYVKSATNDNPFQLDTGSSNGAHLRFFRDGTQLHFFGCGGGISLGDSEDLSMRSYDNILFSTGNSSTERVRITSDGKVGINDSSPANQLVVKAPGGSGHTVSAVLSGDASTKMSMQVVQGTEGRLGMNTNHPLALYSGGLEKLRIETSGDLQFYSADSIMHTTADTSRLRLFGGSSNSVNNGAALTLHGVSHSSGNYADLASGSGGHIQFRTGTNERLRITSAGHLLHGVTADEDTSGSGGLRFINTGDIQIDGDQKALVFRSTNSTAQKQSGIEWWNENGAGVQCSIFGIREAISQAPSALAFYTSDNVDTTSNNGEGNITERMRITSDGYIYGPGGARKNWFDNGSFDCIGGRRANTSMDYGNHHAYGWVTDRFQSRNSVQWTRSTNVPTGKGFSYSTQTNGAGGQLVQAVELPDYGDMGVFTPGSYWCVSFWSTAGCNPAGAAFSYDLGSTKTDIPTVGSGGYASTGETAAGTSTGTFTRYFRVFGPMPNSIISGAIAAYWQWGFTAAGYTTGFQLERVPTSTSKPTPYEHVHPAVTTARCRRYCYQNVNSRLHNGYKRHDSNIHWSVQFPVPPTHMPSGSNQSATPYGIHLHDGGLLTNFQSILQNPGVNSATISEFDYRSGRFIIVGSTSYSPTHVTVPSWESQEYEIGHGFF